MKYIFVTLVSYCMKYIFVTIVSFQVQKVAIGNKGGWYDILYLTALLNLEIHPII